MVIKLNMYKPKVEKIVSKAIEKDFKINGDIKISIFPMGFAVHDINIKNPKGFGDANMLKLGKVCASVNLLALMDNHVKINCLEFENLDLSVQANKKGKLNLLTKESFKEEKSEPKKADKKEKQKELPSLKVEDISVVDANITYKDLSKNQYAKIDGLNIQVEHIVINSFKDILRHLSLAGNIQVQSIKYDKLNIKDFDASFDFKDGVAIMDPMEFSIFDSLSKGKIRYDISKEKPKINIENLVEELNLAVFSTQHIKSDKVSLDGFLKTDIKISSWGLKLKEIKTNLNGNIYIAGEDFEVKGADIDKILNQYDKSQNVDAIDVGAFLVAGPLGVALSKGSDLGSAGFGLGSGKSIVKKMVVDVPLKGGLANLKDVAISTKTQRVALKGALDLPKESFVNVEVGVLDFKGCAKYSQKISGTFSMPKVETAKLATSTLTGAVSSIFGKIKKAVSKEEKCKPFYKGSVAHPKPKI